MCKFGWALPGGQEDFAKYFLRVLVLIEHFDSSLVLSDPLLVLLLQIVGVLGVGNGLGEFIARNGKVEFPLRTLTSSYLNLRFNAAANVRLSNRSDFLLVGWAVRRPVVPQGKSRGWVLFRHIERLAI
jgi:hypothetical protein